MKPLNYLLTFILLLGVAVPSFAQREQEKYLAGAVPEIDGKVIFTENVHIPNTKKEQIFNQAEKWMEKRFNTQMSRVVYKDMDEGTLVALGNDTIVFKSAFLSLDQTAVTYQFIAQVKDGECNLKVDKISYTYGQNERFTAEEMISDKQALNKSQTKLVRGLSKWRVKTIDYFDELFEDATNALYEIAPRENIGLAPHPAVSQREMKPTTVEINKPSTNIGSAEKVIPAATFAGTTATINSTDINLPKNVYEQIGNSNLVITITKDGEYYNIPIDAIEFGYAFGKPIASVFVPFGSELYDALENSNTFSVSLYSKDNASKDKANLKVVCKKILSQSITPESIVDQSLRKELGAKALQKFYIGEIIDVWSK